MDNIDQYCDNQLLHLANDPNIGIVEFHIRYNAIEQLRDDYNLAKDLIISIMKMIEDDDPWI